MKIVFRFCLIVFFALLVQGCSFVHFFELRNQTDESWSIEYEINDDRGVFQNEVWIYKKKPKNYRSLEFENKQIQFALHPKETAVLFRAMNTSYSVYKHQLQYDPKAPWIDFLNVSTINIVNHLGRCQLDTGNLDDVLSKSNMRYTRVDIDETIEELLHVTP